MKFCYICYLLPGISPLAKEKYPCLAGGLIPR